MTSTTTSTTTVETEPVVMTTPPSSATYASTKGGGGGGAAPRSLYECVTAADEAGHSRWYAALACSIRKFHPDQAGFDPWMLALTLGTVLAYLYFRNEAIVVGGFLVYLTVEFIIYAAVCFLTYKTVADVRRTHSREMAHLLDPLVFALANFVGWYLIDYSALGREGAGASEASVARHASTWRSLVVVSVAIALSGHWKLHGWSFLIILATIWLVHATSAGSHDADYSLWVSKRATTLVVFFYAFFIRPIGWHFANNAFISLNAALFVISIVHVVLVQEN